MKQNDQEYEKVCALCEHALPLRGGEERLLCDKKGVVTAEYHCGKFSFDPLKCRPLPRPSLRELEGVLPTVQAGSAAETDAAKKTGNFL